MVSGSSNEAEDLSLTGARVAHIVSTVGPQIPPEKLSTKACRISYVYPRARQGGGWWVGQIPKSVKEVYIIMHMPEDVPPRSAVTLSAGLQQRQGPCPAQSGIHPTRISRDRPSWLRPPSKRPKYIQCMLSMRYHIDQDQAPLASLCRATITSRAPRRCSGW